MTIDDIKKKSTNSRLQNGAGITPKTSTGGQFPIKKVRVRMFPLEKKVVVYRPLEWDGPV